MPIFISYAHADKEFVDRLAVQLVRAKVNVWLDRWELHVGDSLVTRIQEAITGASALLVILSKASVQSEWCRKELSSGLWRELAENRVVVLPVLLEDCEIPLFLRDKLYADFRRESDTGLRTILESVAKISNEWQSRVDAPKWHIDWAIDWEEHRGDFGMRLTLVEQADGLPYSVLTVVQFVAAKSASNRYRKLVEEGRGDAPRHSVVAALVKQIEDGLDLTVQLSDQFERKRFMTLDVPDLGKVSVRVSARRLGEDTGRSVLLHLGQQLQQIYWQMKQVSSGPGTRENASPAGRSDQFAPKK